jgi:peptidoglycan pentaglycine glycine transferase (the first glycine)
MISVKEINDKNIWSGFVKSVAPPTFLHSWEWGEFQERIKTPIIRLGVWEGERLCAVALILKIRAKRGSFLFCPHGPIIPSSGSANGQNIDSSSILKAITSHLTAIAKREGYDFIRIAPMMADSPESRALYRGLGFRHAPIHMHPELAWILDLEPSEDELLKAMRKTSRYSIRKADNDGVRVSIGSSESDLEAFWSVYGTTVKRQHFTPFSKEFFRAELNIFSAQNSASIFIGSVKDEPVSAAFVVFDEVSGYYHHGASSQAYPKIPASHLVLWTAIREAKRRGCRTFNFWGISPDDRPDHPWAGLSLFKKGFGGRVESYVPAQDLVVAPAYWVNWMIESVRKKVRGL